MWKTKMSVELDICELSSSSSRWGDGVLSANACRVRASRAQVSISKYIFLCKYVRGRLNRKENRSGAVCVCVVIFRYYRAKGVFGV